MSRLKHTINRIQRRITSKKILSMNNLKHAHVVSDGIYGLLKVFILDESTKWSAEKNNAINKKVLRLYLLHAQQFHHKSRI